MTFTHKLARRLAILRALPPHCAMVPALALIVACSAGVPTGVDTGTANENAPLVVNPRSLILEANQVSVFKAYASGVPGDSLVTSIEWTATGGSIGLDGTYSSPSTGDYKVVGKRHGPTRTTSDTAKVTVVPPQPTVTSVIVSPQPATVTAKTQQTFSAVGKLSDGSAVAIGVTWTATGGSIDPGGVYTAGSTAGAYQVIAKAASANVADTVPVTVINTVTQGSGTGLYPHEPAGFARVVEHSFDHDPGSGAGGTEYAIAGGHWFTSGTTFPIGTDASAPQSPQNVLRYIWPAGLVAGSSPGQFGGDFSGQPQRELYVSYRVKIPTPDFENQAVATKLLGYISYGKTDRRNQFFLHLDGNGSNSVQRGPWTFTADFTMAYDYSSTPGYNKFPQNQAGASFYPGSWQQVELYFKLNTDGLSNGIFKMWVNGKLVTSVTQAAMINSAAGATLGFYQLHFDPVWGGTGGSKSRSDEMWIDHIYVSGIPQ